MLQLVIILVVPLFTYYLLCFLCKPSNPQKIFNVYSQPGKWYSIKYCLSFVFLTFRKLNIFLKTTQLEKLEELKPLSKHDQAFDATLFQGVSQNGFYFCGGIERRHQAKAHALFYVVTPDFGLLESTNLPNTLVEIDPETVLLLKQYRAAGISFEPIEPMKKWHVSFAGKMRSKLDPEVLLEVKLAGQWRSKLPHFDFDTDLSISATARAMARETWNQQFFNNCKIAHQSHYEQMGQFTGTLTIEDRSYKLEMNSFRDHSFGLKRDWSLMHRYVIHMLYLEDHTKICIGVISQPCTFSFLETGYLVLSDGTITPIDACNFMLYQHGENGNPGKNYGFTFSADETIYDVKIETLHESSHYKGTNDEAKLTERFVKCRINGIKGRGIAEWHYNNNNDSE